MSLKIVRDHLANGRVDSADRTLRDLRRSEPENAEVAIEHGFCAIRQGRWQVAVARFHDAARRFSDTGAISIGLAEAYLGAGRADEAQRLIDRASELFEGNPWVAITAAKTALAMGAGDRGAARIEALLKSSSDDALFASAVAILCDAKFERLADDLLLRARTRFPDSLAVLQMAATRSARERRWDEALENWTSLLQRSPESTLATRGIAEAHDRMGVRGRTVVAIYGNCQAEFIARLLCHLPEIARRFAFIVVSNVAPPGQSIPTLPGEIAQARILFEQHDRQQNVSVRDRLRKQLPSDVHVLRFPAMQLSCLWPFAWPDNRLEPEPAFPWTRYPWGDRIAIEVSKIGLSADDAYATYRKRSREKMPDPQALLDRDLALAELRDGSCDVKMRPYIEENVRRSHLFWTWGHTSGELMGQLAQKLIAAAREWLGTIDDDVLAKQLAMVTAMFPGQGNEQMPIHPDIARRLRLEYAAADRRYEWFGNRWTYEEYFRRYLTLDANWSNQVAMDGPVPTAVAQRTSC